MERFGLSDIQAQAILDMRLKTLSGLQREKIEEEYNELMKLIAHLREILGSEKLVFEIIKEELTEVKEKYGDERLTKIVAAEGEFNEEDLIKEEQMVVALTHFGYIKRMPIDTYRSQKEAEKVLVVFLQGRKISLNKYSQLLLMIQYCSLAIKENCID